MGVLACYVVCAVVVVVIGVVVVAAAVRCVLLLLTLLCILRWGVPRINRSIRRCVRWSLVVDSLVSVQYALP